MVGYQHQFIERETGIIRDERLLGDKAVNMLYSVAREKAPVLFRALTGSRASSLLGFVCYDATLEMLFGKSPTHAGIDFSECVEPKSYYNTPRRIFQRQIRYWECRPMADELHQVVAPADSRVLVGSLAEASDLFLKEKFFSLQELLGHDKSEWIETFTQGDFAVFRLTPDKYHYNHTPVAGTIVDFYQITGAYHSCNPTAVVRMVTPFSKNARFVTVVDTDVPNGTGVGLVAMIEVVALMIGDIVQTYCEEKYDCPRLPTIGMSIKKGFPKSLFRPGSSTDVLLFQKDRVCFSDDLVHNRNRSGIRSRFSLGFGRPLVETDLKVRSPIARAAEARL